MQKVCVVSQGFKPIDIIGYPIYKHNNHSLLLTMLVYTPILPPKYSGLERCDKHDFELFVLNLS